MKKLMIIGAILCSGLVFASVMMTDTQNEVTATASSSEMAPSCRKFTDICPNGEVGYHCAMTTNLSLPTCRFSPTGQCAQIWPCEPVSND